MRKTAAALALAVTALTATGCSALEHDYPAGDPAVLSGRLTDRAQWAYGAMALPRHEPVAPARVEPRHSCQKGGLAVDETARDAVTFGLGWTVPDVPAGAARPAEARLRRAFTTAGWKITHDGNRQGEDWTELGFRAQDPATGDQFDLAWNSGTTSLFLTGYTPCARVPQDVADAAAVGEEWTPRAS
ncbi:hypothetical protein ACIGO8_18505 [Streptomyces sp. NPDC053493]|uniref:hypothetical protein n=1 Tax=Streptomyces sp. NPDC053493 TaxID=3365705 RepID=UPI0037D276AD